MYSGGTNSIGCCFHLNNEQAVRYLQIDHQECFEGPSKHLIVPTIISPKHHFFISFAFVIFCCLQ